MHSPSPQHAANRRGVLAMAAGMAAFAVNDTFVKFVSQSLPAPQLIFLRGIFSIVLLLGLIQASGAMRHLPRLLDRRVMLRAFLDGIATLAYLVSLFHLPLANTTAINMAAPLFVTLYAIAFFGERVAAGRWVAIVAGFIGVLLVVQPRSDAFNAWALLCLFAAWLNASRDVVTRTIATGVPVLVITLSTALTVTAMSGGWALLAQAWQPVSGQQLGLLAGASVVLSVGYYLITLAMRSGEMSVIAPFRYAGLLAALVLGYLVWGDVPNGLATAGIVLLVVAGLALLRGRPRVSTINVAAKP
ncbi:DMT family transporter [Ramlibacter sp. G-1-2-2]|uniref:DMT family transporter n=1 Tax=Ramlibacter agri TaxID=2728837 RepID=A0A848HEU7_9BURK|nr:DMT family transporter [Ramlibacter agri]NML46118.1 DMT family transporter [Ramlibacter agri]